jgi:parafibromin
MSPGTPNIQARGFFFDLSPPKEDVDSEGHTPISIHTSTGSGSAATSVAAKNSPTTQWWEADTNHQDKGNKSSHAKRVKKGFKSNVASSSFELSLPEHLPNSPLCPKNPKHKSGGAGICVYHGRKRSNALKNIKRASTGESELMKNSSQRGCQKFRINP